MSQPSEEIVTEALAAAREELDMDVAVLCEMRRGREVFGVVEGDAERFPFLEDGSLPFEETICSKVLSGRVSNAVPDVATEEERRRRRPRHRRLRRGAAHR